MVSPNNNWRNDPGLVSKPKYRKKFAFLPTRCSDNTKVWMKFYYKKYTLWFHGEDAFRYDDEYLHTDSIENITEAEYIVRKLAETL